MRFAGKRALVLGAGVAGISAARVLAEEGAAVRLSDSRPGDELDSVALERIGAEVRAGGHAQSDLDGIDLVVTSPGIPPSHEVLRWALERDVPVWSEMELGARVAEMPYLAVTGTNGKTTTTGMLAACLVAAGIDAKACGNIGYPFPVAARGDNEALVVEVSSFQLLFQSSFHPRISVLLNLAPDHLDWHGGREAYAAAKAEVFARQGPGDTHVGNRDDDAAAAISAEAPCDVVWFRSGVPGAGEVGYESGELVSRLAGEARIGHLLPERPTLRADAAAAAAAALAFGVDASAVSRGLASYVPPRHRGEVVATAGEVRFIDDSKATNVHAALAAIDAAPLGAVLIAGGRAKDQDLRPLATRADRLRAVVAIGESAADLFDVFDGRTTILGADSMEEAVLAAWKRAEPGGVVLLAPACASWDQFRSYEERGDRFAAAARALAAEVGDG